MIKKLHIRMLFAIALMFSFNAMADMDFLNVGGVGFLNSNLTVAQASSLFTDPSGSPLFLSITNVFKALPPRGYKCDGWYASPDLFSAFTKLSSDSYTKINGDTIKVSEQTFTRLGYNNMPYLIPSFDWLTYTIKYDANGADGFVPTDNKTYKYTNTVNVASLPASMSLKGSKFKGWGLDPQANEVFNPGAKIINAGDRFNALSDTPVILYALWEEIAYDVNFHPNGGVGEMENQKILSECEVQLSSNLFTRVGYRFYGWNTKADNSGDYYTDGMVVSNLLQEAGKFDLYAQWYTNTYSIVFNPNGGEGEMASVENIFYDSQFILPQNTFTKENFAFLGWATNENGEVVFEDKATIYNLTAEHEASNTFYAVWNDLRCTISFDLGGATGTISNINSHKGATITLPNGSSLSKLGCSFAGWKNNTTQTVYPAGASFNVEGNATFTAVWESVDGPLRAALDLPSSDTGYVLTKDGWDVTANPTAVNGTCLITSNNESIVAFHFNENGKLSFNWKTINNTPYYDEGYELSLKYVGDNEKTIGWGNKNPATWQSYEIAVTNAPVTLNFKFDTNDDQKLFVALLDNFSWTPDGTPITPDPEDPDPDDPVTPDPQDEKPEPTVADAPKITDVTMNGNIFNITFKTDVKFDYELNGTNEFSSIRPWPLFKTINPTGEVYEVEIPILKNEKKMFYYLRTIKKK